MNRKKFIERMEIIGTMDPVYVGSVVKQTMNEIQTKYDTVTDDMKQHLCASETSMCLMEEAGELLEAVSARVRERIEDNHDIVEECADVILDILCICELFEISHTDLQKAIMVKAERQWQRLYWK